MNLKLLVKLSNIVAAISIMLLIYWVFIFISVSVFGLRIFRENISEIFGMSVLGILALMGGSLMINVMFNLTRIAQKHNQDQSSEREGGSKKWVWVFALSFPILFGFLFAGDYLTSLKKENMLIQSARSIVESNTERTGRLLAYEFSKPWLIETRDTLDLFERTDGNMPNVSVIVKDSIDSSNVFLAFKDYSEPKDEAVQPIKQEYIFKTGAPEREYLNRVFSEGYTEIRFSASDGKYELFYPYSKDNKIVVLYFSDYQRFGKIGS